MTSEAIVYAANDVASVVRCAARAAAASPEEWGESVLIEGGLDTRITMEPVQCTIAPFRRAPGSEFVRVNFLEFNGVAASQDFLTLIVREVCPFVIGVGELSAQYTPKGFKIFFSDNSPHSLRHEGNSMRIGLSEVAYEDVAV
jgi:hypothetical protein